MATIAWNEAVPSNTSYVRDLPTFMQSATTAMATALGTHVLYWTPTSGSATSIGEMQPGGSRTYYGAASLSSNADNANLGQRLFTTSDTTKLLCYDSAGTYRVGTPFFVEFALGPIFSSVDSWVKPATWLFQSGSVGASGSLATVTFPKTYLYYPRTVTGALGGSSIGVEYQISLSTWTTGGAIFDITVTPGYSPGVYPTVYWTSLGTVEGPV